ncbi:MAG: HEAT repeat domain-containing protein [Prochlorococcaceae cyanobacterium ETNP18_MAG_1]|nr:HEAT repeat domain-containing protein [Prochlorococcaceae cyanobacterium ETNP18_MAG_1]
MLKLNDAIAQLDQANSTEALIVATRQLASLTNLAAAPKLIEVLSFNNPAAALVAVDGLIALGQDVVPSILSNLDAHNYGARAWAIRVLADLGDVRGITALIDALLNDVGPSVRRTAARGLGDLRLKTETGDGQEPLNRCIQALLQARKDGEWVVRYAITTGLERQIQSEQLSSALKSEAYGVLEELASDQEDTNVVRQRAKLALQRLTAP